MICPIISGLSIPIQGIDRTEIAWAEMPCKEKECAWWDEDEGCCSIRTLTKQIFKSTQSKSVQRK